MILEVFRQVLESLLRNKLRSFLTMSGIAWGVASIVLIVAMGDGFKDGQRKNTKSLGDNVVIVWGGRTERQAGGERAGRRIRLMYSDVRDIRAEGFLINRISAELMNDARVTSNFNSGTFQTHGVEPDFAGIRTIPIDAGRFLSQQDEDGAERVCVIGSNVKKQLFGTRPARPGADVRVNGMSYRVVGFIEEKNQNSSYSGRDVDAVFIPYATMARDLPPKDKWYQDGNLSNFVYQPKSVTEWEEAQKQVRRIVGRNHAFDPADDAAIRMWDTVESAKMVDGIFTSMTAFLGVIALVTLTLGGVGVMNIMLVTVTERTQEIGIRKALGATRRRILFDFLLEGMLLALLSGGIGWAGSWGLAALVNSFPMPEMFGGLPVKTNTTFIAFGSLAVVAVASALVPAWRAASLTPVEALRFER